MRNPMRDSSLKWIRSEGRKIKMGIKRDQEVCCEFDLLLNKVMEEDKEFFNYFVSYTLGLMKNKMDEFDMKLIRNMYRIMKKGRDDVKEIRKGDYSSIEKEVVNPPAPHHPDCRKRGGDWMCHPDCEKVEDLPKEEDESEVEVSDCCYSDYHAHLLGYQGSINAGPPDPVEYCNNCNMRCETIYVTKEELGRFHETGEKVKR